MRPERWIKVLLEPELAALAAIDPAAATGKIATMARDPWGFQRGALPLVAPWLAQHALDDTPWVWAVGDAHLGNFATLCVGAVRDERIPATFGIADVDDEHPAPWPWDLVRFLASLFIAQPGLGRREREDLCQGLLTSYGDIIERLAEGDALATRIDQNGLPETVKTLVTAANDPPRAARFLTRLVRDDRFRKHRELVADPPAIASIRTAWSRIDTPAHQVLDGARRRASGGVGSLGRKRWLLLIDAGNHRRLLECKERRPSVLARVLPTTPFTPQTAGGPLTIAMGNDPFQRLLRLPAIDLLVRTRCHARDTIAGGTLDEGDRRRLMHLIGQLLATFHAEGLGRLLTDHRGHLRRIAAGARAWRKPLSTLAEDLTEFLTQSHRAFAAEHG